MPVTNGVDLRPLAEVARGEQLEVVDFLFDTVRELCPTLGLHPGDVLSCEARTPHDIVLRSTTGKRIVVDRFYAAFVAVHLFDRPASAQRRTPDAPGTRLSAR